MATLQYSMVEITSATKTATKKHTVAANKFSVIEKLFKSRSEKFNTDKFKTDEIENLAAPTSPGWFASFRRKSKFAKSTPDQTPHRNRYIIILPNQASCDTPSGKSVKKKSASSASSRRVKSTTNFTGLILGLSRLVQPSPVSCELRVLAKAKMSTSSLAAIVVDRQISAVDLSYLRSAVESESI